MRLQRGTDIAGVDPELARTLARACAERERDAETLGEQVQLTEEECERLLDQLTAEGYLRRGERTQPPYGTFATWETTTAGNALAMASFLKPMKRAKAETLLAGVVERAEAYNGDPTKLMWISRITAFGSYVSEATELGDLDLHVVYGDRYTYERMDRVKAYLKYTRESGRTFSSYPDKLFWPAREVKSVLKNRSGFIHIHDEDLDLLAGDKKIVFEQHLSPTEALALGDEG